MPASEVSSTLSSVFLWPSTFKIFFAAFSKRDKTTRCFLASLRAATLSGTLRSPLFFRRRIGAEFIELVFGKKVGHIAGFRKRRRVADTRVKNRHQIVNKTFL